MFRQMTLFLAGSLLSLGFATPGFAHPLDPMESESRFDQRNLSGPRFGVTFVPGRSELREEMKSRDMGRTVSQFGWHFEKAVVPKGGGPQLVVEFLPMIAGVEHGLFLPNITLAMGIRTNNGFEFGVGPNVTAGFDQNHAISSALVVAVGKTFDYGGVSVPLNFAYSTSPNGDRLSMVLGYAIQGRR